MSENSSENDADRPEFAAEPPPGVTALAAAIADGTTTASAVAERTLSAIAETDPQLGAFTVVLADRAREHASALDAKARAGDELGPLHGVPVAIKAENDVAGVVTSFGGRAFDKPAQADSVLVQRLVRAGAVVVGVTAMPEFGIWPFTESRAFGTTRNPWTRPSEPARSPAGSSGGSAAAVASGLVPFAIGGDGGGSIRLPSAWCGLFGLKLGRGRITAAPNPDLWRSLGTAGPLTRSVVDSAVVYDIITGTTSVDNWRDPNPLPNLSAAAAHEPDSLRITVSTAAPAPGTPAPEASVSAAVNATGELLAALGHRVESIDPRYPKVSLEFLMEMVGGVRDEAARADHPELLEKRTRTLARAGKAIDGPRRSAWAQRRIGAASQRWNGDFFSRTDLLVIPTVHRTAVLAGQLDSDSLPRTALRGMPIAAYTSLWNVLGNPAASIPAGFDQHGLPLAVQLVAAPGREDLLVSVAAQLERASERHRVFTPSWW